MTAPAPKRNPIPEDPAVEAEWRKIEEERIAEEVEEGAEEPGQAGSQEAGGR